MSAFSKTVFFETLVYLQLLCICSLNEEMYDQISLEMLYKRSEVGFLAVRLLRTFISLQGTLRGQLLPTAFPKLI